MKRLRNVLFLPLGISLIPAFANVYTSSTAYNSAVAGMHALVVENYSSGFAAGDLIASGDTIHGITYSSFIGFNNADITTLYNSFSGFSLGADNTGGGAFPLSTFFFGNQGLTITFSQAVNAAGIFFNVFQNTGQYGFITSGGDSAFTDSVTYDTHTFVFAGITSAVPFTSLTFYSTDPSRGGYNVPEIEASATPEPSYYIALAAGLAALFTLRRYRSLQN